ncbi:MAG: NmrA/HSCARG family protein [Acidobacteria bacterium]|nr:NmrA/HSCARG family protein [Acidobacteriota bacterium]
MPPKVIAVVGATGTQGGGLVRAILNDESGEFAARALTRDVNSEKARELARMGVEVVAADVDDVKSLERAFAGAYGAFCVTFFWHHMSAERETAEARNMAVAAKAAGVQHVIWSTLEDMRKWVPLSDDRMPTLQGKYKVPHFDAKGEANRFFLEMGLPVTLLNTSFYWDNFIHFGAGPKPGPDGVLVLGLPLGDKLLPGIAAGDIGKCALGVFKAGRELVGKEIGIAGEHLTGRQLAEKMSRALGREVRYEHVPPAVYRSFGFPGADDMGNMFHVQLDFNEEFVAARDVGLARRLNPALQSFDAWLERHAHEIPIESAKSAGEQG